METNAGEALCSAALALALVLALALIHGALIALADFSGRERPGEAPLRELMVFDLSPPPAAPPPPAVIPVEPRPVAKAPPPPPPEPAPVELVPEEPVPAPMEPVEGAFGGEPPAENSGVVGAAAFAGMAVPVALSGRPPMSEAEYTALVMKRLEEKKVYPLAMRKRGIEGDAAVRFTIRPDGSLGSIRAGDAPAHPFLAQAALETVRAAAPFPVMEGHGGDYALNVTIRFQLE